MRSHIGHIDDTGIQGHSCGPLFPWMILGIGNTLVAFDGVTGDQYPIAHEYDFSIPGSFAKAHQAAEEDAKLMIALERAVDVIEKTRHISMMELAV